ncbi:MAG: hypothetical protein M3548_03550 [Actinomycetota bacterium]|nr:hypothetical protein [Actinomycetota bacterium]
MYIDESEDTGGWRVEPERVREFAAAVEEVRADLDSIFAEVGELTGPAYLPMLGTSPVGQELADKFTDRLGSETGLRGQLEQALTRMNEFVASAEKSAAGYQHSDDHSAARFRRP